MALMKGALFVLDKCKARLIDGVEHWWRLWSVQILIVSGAIQLELAAFPDTLKGYLPDWFMHWLSIGLLVLAVAARVTKQPRFPNNG